MSRALTPKDAHVLMNLLVKEATGQDATIQVVDSSSFVSAGETVLATGTENTINSLAIVLGKTLMAVRPYKALFNIISAMNTNLYNTRMRKISVYSKEAQASGDWNTQLFTNLANGFDNGENPTNLGVAQSTKSMWVQNPAVVLEMNFAGQSVWEDSLTLYDNQLKVAFRSDVEFANFVTGIMTEKSNDIESQKEAFNRMCLLNYMAGLYDLQSVNATSVINLTAGFNAKFGTNYTSAQLRTTYFDEFLAYFVSEFQGVSDKMLNRSAKYHWSPTKTVGGTSYTLLRHTPKDRQKAVMLASFFRDAKAQVLPAIFNPNYLDIKNFESVEFWQNENDPSAIKVTPAIPDTTDPSEQTAGTTVNLPYVLGMIFDEDAILTDYQFEDANTTPLEARKRFRNVWYTFSKNAINDFTENAVLFIMEDPAPEPDPET